MQDLASRLYQFLPSSEKSQVSEVFQQRCCVFQIGGVRMQESCPSKRKTYLMSHECVQRARLVAKLTRDFHFGFLNFL